MRVTHRSQKFSKIKIRTSSPCKAHLGSYDDEVRILFFDDPAEEKQSKRPVPRYPDSVPPVYSIFANIPNRGRCNAAGAQCVAHIDIAAPPRLAF